MKSGIPEKYRLAALTEERDPLKNRAALEGITALDAGMFPGNPWGRAGFEESVSNEYDFLVAAEADDSAEILGYGLLRCFDDAEVIRIAVSEASRRQGIGRMLLAEMIAHAKACGAAGIFLEVRSGNTAAVGLYREAGFTEEGIRKGYYHDPPEDALIMRYSC